MLVHFVMTTVNAIISPMESFLVNINLAQIIFRLLYKIKVSKTFFRLFTFFFLFPGAIFHAGDEEYMNAFKKAVIETRSEHIAPSFKVETSIKQVEVNTDSFKTAAAGSYEY